MITTWEWDKIGEAVVSASVSKYTYYGMTLDFDDDPVVTGERCHWFGR